MIEFDTAIKLTTPQMETMLALHRGEDVSVTASDEGELEGCVHVDPDSDRIGTLIDPQGRGLGISLSTVKGAS